MSNIFHVNVATSTQLNNSIVLSMFQAFVESNPNIKWCPYPGCCQAVKVPETHAKLPSDTSKAVDCGKGHLFCW